MNDGGGRRLNGEDIKQAETINGQGIKLFLEIPLELDWDRGCFNQNTV